MSDVQSINKLPAGWQCIKLGDVGEVGSGVTLGRALRRSVTRSVPYLRVANVKDGQLDLSYVKDIEATESEIDKCRLEPGDLLLTEGGDPDKLGRGTVWKGELPECIHQNHIFRVRFPKDKFSPEFLSGLMSSEYGKAYFLAHAKQTTGIASINQKVLKAFPLLVPSLPEQKRIAALLSKHMAVVEKARAAAEERLKAAKELPLAYLRQVFENEDARGWPKKKIGDFAKVQSGYAFKSEWFAKSGIRLLRNANVSQGCLDWNDAVYLPEDRRTEFASYELTEGDIVLSLDRPWVSNGLKVSRLSDSDLPCLLLQRVGRFCVNDNIDRDYLYTFLNSPSFIDEITEHDQSLGVPHVSPKQVEGISIPVPSRARQLEVAREMMRRKTTAERLVVIHEEELTAINSLPAALLRMAYSGDM